MEAVLAKYENQINVLSEFLEDFPDTDEPVWILGVCYNIKTPQMGVGEGKSVGEWYGPNTVAQVLKSILVHWRATQRLLSQIQGNLTHWVFSAGMRKTDSWCDLVQQKLLGKGNLRMFELVKKHPSHWPPFVPPTKPEVHTTGAEFIEPPENIFESEEEFEILNV